MFALQKFDRSVGPAIHSLARLTHCITSIALLRHCYPLLPTFRPIVGGFYFLSSGMLQVENDFFDGRDQLAIFFLLHRDGKNHNG